MLTYGLLRVLLVVPLIEIGRRGAVVASLYHRRQIRISYRPKRCKPLPLRPLRLRLRLIDFHLLLRVLLPGSSSSLA
jgi:hypothetical protein